MKINSFIRERLFNLKNEEKKKFDASLLPTLDCNRILGIKLSDLRDFAKELSKRDDIDEFLNDLPHYYYEENNLHAFIIENIKDYEKCIILFKKFLPFIDNWAKCDCFRPKCFKKNSDKLLKEIDEWLLSNNTYTIRFAIGMLMSYYLDDRFETTFLDRVANIKSDEYYVNMMIAWYFATALAKQYDETIKILENNVLPTWTHNKTIQKAIESRRITTSQKDYLRSLKIKR